MERIYLIESIARWVPLRKIDRGATREIGVVIQQEDYYNTLFRNNLGGGHGCRIYLPKRGKLDGSYIDDYYFANLIKMCDESSENIFIDDHWNFTTSIKRIDEEKVPDISQLISPKKLDFLELETLVNGWKD